MNEGTLQKIREILDQEISSLKNEIAVREQKLQSLQILSDELIQGQGNEINKEKYNEITQLYEQEKDRLVKLHYVYKEKDAECEALKKELKIWQDWLEANKHLFEQLTSLTPPGSKTEPEIEEPSPSLVPPLEKDMPFKAERRRLRFKKN